MKIEKGRFVAISYKLYDAETEKEGEELDILEDVTDKHPFSFIYNAGQAFEQLEKQLENKEVGDSFDFQISSEEAYGDYDANKVVDVPKEAFSLDGKFDTDAVFVDALLPMRDPEGNQFYGKVLSITEEAVEMDFNHPYAGLTLHFVGKVETVRVATPQELNPEAGCSGCSSCGSGECGDCGSSCQ